MTLRDYLIGQLDNILNQSTDEPRIHHDALWLKHLLSCPNNTNLNLEVSSDGFAIRKVNYQNSNHRI